MIHGVPERGGGEGHVEVRYAEAREGIERRVHDGGRYRDAAGLARALGRLIMFSQYMTAYAGEFYDINAFDQPGVEYGKKLTFAMMGRPGFSSYMDQIGRSASGRQVIR